MSNFGQNTTECLNMCKQLIEKDLSTKTKAKVEISFLCENSERRNLFDKFVTINNFFNEQDLNITNFKESPEVLKSTDKKAIDEHYLKFDILRSNCRVTHQPDFGDLFIYYKSKKLIDYKSMVEYLVSFRNEYHFHEECCEMIFKRLYDILDKADELFVCALYTRRGGIDISPVRYTKNMTDILAKDLIDLTKFARNGIKQ